MRGEAAITSSRSCLADARAAQPWAEATASASAASCCATAAGIRGAGFTLGCSRVDEPQPAASATLDTTSKAFGQRIWQPPFANLLLGSLERVGDAAKPGAAGAEVEQEPGRARVAVARLSDRARIEQEPRVRPEIDVGVSGSVPAAEPAVRVHDRERDVAVADEHERRLGQLERGLDRVGGEHVVPDRIARARVEELDPVASPGRAELRQE